MKGRLSFHIGAVQHVYQKHYCGYVIFYSVKDCLVFFTMFSITARRFGVRVLGLCIMVDHIHVLVDVPDRGLLGDFVRYYTSWFSREYNSWHGLQGQLFKRPFGVASKSGSKSIRSAIAYLYNNPVEKQLCDRPEQSMWNFLAYGASKNPFSEPLKIDKASASLRHAVQVVKYLRSLEEPISYIQLSNMLNTLNRKEKMQLSEYIIRTYNCIDYEAGAGYFGGYDEMVAAINTTKGSEYSIKEDFVSGSDKIYSKMTNFLLKSNVFESIDALLRLPDEKRFELFEPLALYSGASSKKVAKYLHINLEDNTLVDRML